MSNQPKSEESIFVAASALPHDQRKAYLDHACAGDSVLRHSVEALLKSHDEATSFLEQPPQDITFTRTAILAVPATEKIGNRIGRYKLLQQIGEGGCGVVYMAEQEEPVRRRVALKVIKLGMDTKQVIARFEAERQALALMDHPNIARVLDAGATDAGRPYFVMELVEGIKITEFCDKNHLTTEERLKLFISVCQAVQHAHQKGIIHRDIKPSNILVTTNDGAPVPKVIDFGIAKATQGRLTEQTVFTAFEQFLGTPAYMSPEQAEMNAQGVDTRSDIYSLGVLLYELVTGRTPFESRTLLESGVNEIRRIIREEQPQKPSTRLSTLLANELTVTATLRQTKPLQLIHHVRGDLDWIVMKALEKDRNRRYETANGFARDVERSLATARPPSRLYEFRKTVRRHWVGFAATTTVIVVMAVALSISIRLLVREKQARWSEAIAQANAAALQDKLRQSVEQFAQVKTQLGRNQPWDDSQEIQRAAIAELAKQLGIDPALLKAKLPQIASETKNNMNAPIFARASAAYVTKDFSEAEGLALVAVETAMNARPPRTNDAIKAYDMAGNAAGGRPDFPSALRHFRDAEKLTDRKRDPLQWADGQGRIAHALLRSGKPADAVKTYQAALDEYAQAQGETNATTIELRKWLVVSLQQLANRQEAQGDFASAETNNLSALALTLKFQGPEDPQTLNIRHALSIDLNYLGRYAEAEAVQRDVIRLQTKVLGPTAPDTLTERYSLIWTLELQNRLSEAEQEGRDLLAIQKQLPNSGGAPPVQTRLGYVLFTEGKYAEAEAYYRETLARIKKTSVPDGQQHIQIHGYLADTLIAQGKTNEAASEYQIVLQQMENSLSNTYSETNSLGGGNMTNGDALNEIAWMLATCRASAIRNGPQALVLAERIVATTHRKNMEYLDTLAAAYAENGQFAEAVRTEQESIALFPRTATPDADFVFRLGRYKANLPYHDGDETMIPAPNPENPAAAN